MRLSSIVVVGRNREIGCNNKLLWNIPADMAWFKKLTMGRSVIMGDRTFESIGAPLPGRNNIVISLDKNYQAPGCVVVHSLDDAVKSAKNSQLAPHSPDKKKGEAFVIGGATIYKLFMPLIDRLYITEVDDAPLADVYFPDYAEFNKIIFKEDHEDRGLKFTFKILERG